MLIFPPCTSLPIVNKQQEKCVKWTHWSDLDDDVGKKSNTSGILKFFMVVGTHLCKMATLLCHPRLSRPLNVSRQIGGNHEIPLVFVSLGSRVLVELQLRVRYTEGSLTFSHNHSIWIIKSVIDRELANAVQGIGYQGHWMSRDKLVETIKFTSFSLA